MCNRRQHATIEARSSRVLLSGSRDVLRITLLSLLASLPLGCMGYMDTEPPPLETSPDDRSNVDDVGAGENRGAGTGGSDDAGAPRPITEDLLSNEAITKLLVGFKYRGEGYRKVNDVPFPSTVSPDKTVTLWISEAGYDAYVKVSPAVAGSQAALPVGSVIVREVIKNAAVDAITVMLRLQTGAFPLGGDWWYASAGPDGVVKKDAASGTPLIGLLENCGTCHLRRHDDDHLFGAPAAYINKK
jgi:hypothetical protein